MQMTRSEAIEIIRYFQIEANMAIDDWGGLQVDRRNVDSMSNEELLQALNEQNSVEHQHVTAIVEDQKAVAGTEATGLMEHGS